LSRRLSDIPRWTIALRYWDARQEVTWEDEELSGTDEDLIYLIKMQAEVMEGQPVGLIHTGPFTTTDHLSDSLSAFCLIQSMVPSENFLGASGDIPEPPELPEGAIP
jgi:hypothetical protein